MKQLPGKVIFAGMLATICLALPTRGFSRPFRLAALVVNQTIDWNGNHVLVDSFDSANTNWSTASQWDTAKAKDNGDIFVGGSITNSIGIATANIYGRVQVGLGGGAAIGSLGGIGEHSWQATNAPGQIEPGWLSYDTIVASPDVVLPYTSALVPGPGEIVLTNCTSGTNCNVATNYYDHVMYNGDYFATDLSGSTIVVGTARLVLPNGLKMQGNDGIIVATGGSIIIYAGGTNDTVGGNGIIVKSGLARDCKIFCTPSVTALALNGNGLFIGVLVASEAEVRVNGGGFAIEDFMGALVANSLKLNGYFNFHFDESLIPAPAQLGPPWLNSNQFLFSVTGEPGFSYFVEASTNLSDWGSLVTNISPFIFVDAYTNFFRRYYRAVRVPRMGDEESRGQSHVQYR